MKNNKKNTRMTKVEKRRLAFEKRNVKKEQNLARYGAEGGSALVMAKTTEFNRRVIAAVLALVFVLTTIVVGYNFAAKADDDGFKMFESIDDSGFVTRKGIKHNENDDTYDLRMEAYATAPLATKTIDSKTPLDIVMVMDQSASMDTKDVHTDDYYAARNTSFTINDIENGEYYYYDAEDDKYYPVEVDNTSEDAYVKAKNSNGNVITRWTAQEANDWYNNNPNKDNQDLYYLNNKDADNPIFETVYVQKDRWFKNAGNDLSVADFISTPGIPGASSALYVTNNQNRINDYYYNSETDNNKHPFWHRVYYNSHGFWRVFSGGYELYLWYYKNSETGDTISNDTNLTDFSGEYYNELNKSILRVPPTTDGYNARYYTFGGTDTNYTVGNLYVLNETSSTFNRMYTVNKEGAESKELAWPLPGAAGVSSVQSSYYYGDLYAAGYRLYYEKDGETEGEKERVYIADAVNNKTDPAAYNKADHDNIPLYDHYSTRLDEMKTAATNLVSQIAESASEDVDHRIAVVGFTNNGSIKTGNSAGTALVSLTNGDTDADTNKVNDAVDSAINGLDVNANNASKLAKGLETANSIFADDEDNDGSRKRIVIVFTDAQPNEEDANDRADAKAKGAIVKDTYNASLFTVGICIDDDDADTALNKLSSNYFTPTNNPSHETKAGDEYYYSESARTSLNTDVEYIANLLSFNIDSTSLNTSVALNGANSMLKDIISDSFEFPEDFTDENKLNSVTIETASVDSYPANGELQWQEAVPASFNKAWEGKTLTVDGFDYNENYVSAGRDDGQKVIVTIRGLKLKKNAQADPSRRIYSNDEASGIYKKGKENTLFAAFPRPYVDKTTDLVPSGTSGTPENGVVLNKYLTAKENGNYDLTLEAYSTSQNQTVTTKEKIPTDFVVVVDQSGSMDTKDIPADDPTVQNNLYLEDVANGQYYYKDGDNYYRVYGVKDYLYRYYPANYWFTGDIVEHLGADIGWFMGETDATTNIANAFYFREVVNGNTYYIPIKTTIQGKIGTYYMRFSYPSKQTGGNFEFNREETTYSSNGNSPWYKNVLNGDVMTSGGLWATANAAVQTLYPNDNAYTYSTINLLLARPRTGMYVNYPMYGRHLAYTKLCYRDESGAEHEVPSNINGRTTWEYCDDDGIARSAQAANSARPTYSGLYKYNKYIDRISALKGALNEFAEAVANEEDDFGAVDNRISIVGFSSDGYNNTELLTSTRDDFEITSGGYISADYPNNYNGVSKSAADAPGSGWYESALVNACDTDEVGAPEKGDVNDDILEAINALTPYGGTQPEDGLNMAHQILTKRSKTTYTIQSGKDKDNPVDRNTVVIYFTDGRPGNYHESNQYTEANDVVQAAHNIKGYKNTSLFSIGVFGESDGNPLTYDAKNERDSASGEIIRDIPRAQWKYLGGWMETYQTGGTYYCLRRQWRPNGADGYTETANDTIFDYMSVVSSNYPTAENYIAPEWLAGNFNGNYEDATDGVRHKDTAEATNKYYRMASSQETLIEAFMQAITMTSQEIEGDGSLGVNTILRDILNDGTFEMTGNTNVVLQTAKGKADANGVVDFDAPEDPSDDASDLHKAKGDKQVDVWGFDYSTNSIYHGKPEDNEHGLSEHQGRKLIVTLTNVVPNALKTSEGLEDPRLFSNKPESGLLNNGTTVAYFPKPAITRHSYTMDVGADNDKAQFEVTTTLVKGSGATDDLSDVILVKPDGTRVLYSTLDEEDKTFNMGNGQTFYYENVPAGYSVKTSIKAPDSFYEYTFWTNNEATKDTLSTKEQTDRTLNYSDNVLHVTSKSRYRTVTIAESVSGPYALTSDLFSVNLTLTPPDGTYTESTIALASDVTLTRNSHGQYEGSISDLPGNQNEKELRVPAGWTLKVEPVEHGKYDVESGYPKYNTNVDPTQKPIEDDGVVIDQNLTNIFINNISKEITVEGIFNSNGHNWIIYLLVGIAAVAVIGGGIFLWKKKDEFAEQ